MKLFERGTEPIDRYRVVINTVDACVPRQLIELIMLALVRRNGAAGERAAAIDRAGQ